MGLFCLLAPSAGERRELVRTVEQARFVPISAEKLPDAMCEWERYLYADGLDRLVQLGILHAEFEALHPFLDGNGRLGNTDFESRGNK